MLKKIIYLVGAGLLALTQAAAAQTALLPLDSLRAQASRTLYAKRYAEAATLFQQEAAAERLPKARASAYYNLACAQALVGQPQAALRALGQAQRLGFNKLELVRTDTDLASLHSRPEFATIMGRIERHTAQLVSQQSDPLKAKLVTSDITNFWRAYDQVAKDTAHAAAIYQRQYFDRGSVGLQDYYQAKIMSTKQFVANQHAKPAFYRAIRPNTMRIATLTPHIRAGFQKLKELYPAAQFPNVYFVIGRWKTGCSLAPTSCAAPPTYPSVSLPSGAATTLARSICCPS
jgi:hypothetical protein